MLGRAVTAEWRRHGWAVLGLSRGQADVRDRPRLISQVDFFRPQLIVNIDETEAVGFDARPFKAEIIGIGIPPYGSKQV